jgi:hypothetical protein
MTQQKGNVAKVLLRNHSDELDSFCLLLDGLGIEALSRHGLITLSDSIVLIAFSPF